MNSSCTWACARSCRTDQSAHVASSCRTSSRTLVSTKTTPCSILAAQQFHEVVGAPFDLRLAARRLEPIAPLRPPRAGLLHRDPAFAIDVEVDAVAGREAERLAHALWDRDLSFHGHRRCHSASPPSNSRDRHCITAGFALTGHPALPKNAPPSGRWPTRYPGCLATSALRR